uniref:NADH-ubiquinone oxidoreductase chain 6 n=1 Tax=Henschiella sp. PJ-2015 TaxID=1663422 RepID=A0A342D253_9HEMI|nr:NADH dehydrogenase subunit 6 [Henschiella sp. PJ-2015]
MQMNIMILILLTMMLMYLKNPMSFGLNLILQTINISMLSYMMINISWFSYLLFIMMLGGMMILFIYMISIASNEKFNISINMIMNMIMIMFMIMLINYKIKINLNNENNNLMNMNNMNFIMKMFYNNSYYITIMLVIYLLITMIFTSYIINIFEGPMRKKK